MPDTRTASCSYGAIPIGTRASLSALAWATATANANSRAENVMRHYQEPERQRPARAISARPASTVFGVSDGTGEIEIRLGAFDSHADRPDACLWLRVGQRNGVVGATGSRAVFWE